MNNANSLNTCPRCGSSNSLNAKFCSRCGAQLKVPETAVVCPKCHTRNSSLSNFCRSCGTSLQPGKPMKFCPKCGKSLPVDEKSCDCGYAFVSATSEADSKKPKKEKVVKEKVKKERVKKERVKKEKKVKEKVLYNHSKGRIIAIFALLFLAILTVLVTLPVDKRFGLEQFDGGVIHDTVSSTAEGEQTDGEAKVLPGNKYLYELVVDAVNGLTNKFGGNTEVGFIDALGGNGIFIVDLIIVLYAITVVVQFVLYIVRICSGRRPRAGKWFMLGVTLAITILAGLVFGAGFITEDTGNWIKWLGALALPQGLAFGWCAVAVLAQMWLFLLFGAIFRARKLKEDTADYDADYDDYEGYEDEDY